MFVEESVGIVVVVSTVLLKCWSCAVTFPPTRRRSCSTDGMVENICNVIREIELLEFNLMLSINQALQSQHREGRGLRSKLQI